VALAFAWLCGADRVGPQHLEPLAHVLWDDPAGVIRSLETAA
jgi:hypothetical protein